MRTAVLLAFAAVLAAQPLAAQASPRIAHQPSGSPTSRLMPVASPEICRDNRVISHTSALPPNSNRMACRKPSQISCIDAYGSPNSVSVFPASAVNNG